MTKYCSFCNREETPQNKIIEGSDASICKECVETCVDEFHTATYSPSSKGLKPHEIKAELDKYVIGQDEAKKMLAVGVYNHYKRLDSKSKVDIQKTNIWMIGPTGSGKTYLLETLASILDVPLVISDATSLTQAGFVGDDVDTLLEKLLIKAGGDVLKAERGIIYLDEVDKIATAHVEGRSMKRDMTGQGVQEDLLKMIEGSEIHLNVGNATQKRRLIINTKNILFICGGAFVGLDHIIKKRISSPSSKSIGFSISDGLSKSVLQEEEITQQDLIDFGFIPEFVGRVPVIASLNQLSKDDLINILTKPKNAIIKQYQALMKMDGVSLKFNKQAIDYIAEEAIKKKVGARGLKGIIEKKMYDLMFELPRREDIQTITITEEMLTNKIPMLSQMEQQAG